MTEFTNPTGTKTLSSGRNPPHLQGMTEFSHLRAGRTRRASAQRVSRSVSVFSRSTAEPGVRRDETPQCPPCSSVARRGLGFKVSSSAPCRAGCKKRRRRLEKACGVRKFGLACKFRVSSRRAEFVHPTRFSAHRGSNVMVFAPQQALPSTSKRVQPHGTRTGLPTLAKFGAIGIARA